MTFIWAFLLPPVKTSLYFYRYDNTILDKAEGKPVVVGNGDLNSAENGLFYLFIILLTPTLRILLCFFGEEQGGV